MTLIVLDAVLGAMLLVVIALASRAPAQKSDEARATGWLLVAVPLPLVVVLHVAGILPRTTDQALFVTGIVAFAVGSALVLGSRDDDDWREAVDDSPPWWPEFERELEEYSRRKSPRRPLARV
jgi:predicted tellurium resistance membrane protein TerC